MMTAKGFGAKRRGYMKRFAMVFLIFMILPIFVLTNELSASSIEDASNAFTAGDYTRAHKKWSDLADQGNPEAQNSLGWLYLTGLGVSQDYNEAIKWFRRSADQGYAGAQNNLGEMYFNGLGVKQDDFEAIKWYRRAANQGYSQAQHNLGAMYLEGRGTKKKLIKCIGMVQKSCRSGLCQITDSNRKNVCFWKRLA